MLLCDGRDGAIMARSKVLKFESLSPYSCIEGVETCLAESNAAAVKHNVITSEKTIGMIKRYLKLTSVMAAKQRANAHAVPRRNARVAAGRPPSCQASIAANK